MAWRNRGGGETLFRQLLLGAAALASDQFQLELALRHGFGKLFAGGLETLDLGGGHLFLAGGAGGFAVDARQVFLDLGELVLERGGLAEKAQDQLPSRFDGLLALEHPGLQRLALPVDLRHAAARLGDLLLEDFHVLLVGGDLLVEGAEAEAQLARFVFGLGDALLDGAALLDLGFQAAAGALGFDAHFGELPPRFGELLLEARSKRPAGARAPAPFRPPARQATSTRPRPG